MHTRRWRTIGGRVTSPRSVANYLSDGSKPRDGDGATAIVEHINEEMPVMSQQSLTSEQQRLSNLWDAHERAEFIARRPDETLNTMLGHPRIIHVPVMTGGDGKDQVYEFYAEHFLPQIPPDMEVIPVSRTVGQGRVVEEMIARFTHTIPMNSMLPGIDGTRSILDRSIPLNRLIRRDKGQKVWHAPGNEGTGASGPAPLHGPPRTPDATYGDRAVTSEECSS
jgi:hypothetical protein